MPEPPAVLPEMQVPPMAKQPEDISMPLVRVEVALAERKDLVVEPSWIKSLTSRPPAKVEVAVVDVAWKYSATAGPTTESFA